ncbi:hypothetical protein [Flindersiella endophytica]
MRATADPAGRVVEIEISTGEVANATDPDPLARSAKPSDRSCGYAWRAGSETTAQVIAAQSVDTVSIVYQKRDSDPATAGGSAVELADGVLARLAAP